MFHLKVEGVSVVGCFFSFGDFFYYLDQGLILTLNFLCFFTPENLWQTLQTMISGEVVEIVPLSSSLWICCQIWLQLKAPLCEMMTVWQFWARDNRSTYILVILGNGHDPESCGCDKSGTVAIKLLVTFYCVKCILGRHLCWRCCKFWIMVAVEVMPTATYSLLLHICRHSLDCFRPRKCMSYWSAEQIFTGFKRCKLYGKGC